jgi:hypothetical protein
LDLFALPQLDGGLAAFDESELHDVEHANEFHDGQDREKGTEGKPNPEDELIKNQTKAGVCDIEFGKIVLVGVGSGRR